MEVRPRRAGESLVGVFVASGGLEAGDLVGCYTGAIVDGAARAAKQQVAPESHLFAINATHAPCTLIYALLPSNSYESGYPEGIPRTRGSDRAHPRTSLASARERGAREVIAG